MGRDQFLLKAWRAAAVRSLPRSAQALFAQLLTQEAPSMAGIVPLMPAKWASVCEEISEVSVMDDLVKLSEVDLVVVDPLTFEVLIRDFIRDTGGFRHKHHFKGAVNAALLVESELLRGVLALELKAIGTPAALEYLEIVASRQDPDPSRVEPESDPDGIEVVDGWVANEA